MATTVEAFLAAISKRRLNFKEAAYLGGVHPKVVRRLASGETKTLCADLVAQLVKALPDGQEFLSEIYGVARPDPLAAIKRDIADLRAAMAPGARASYWFDEAGRQIAAWSDLESAARLALRLPPEVDASAYVMRNLGWVGVQNGEIVALPDAARPAHEAAQRFIDGEALPDGWTATRVAPDRVDPRDRRLIAAAADADDLRSVLVSGNLMGSAALYRVDPDAVTTVWLGDTLKTEGDALGTTLRARRDHRFADMLERQIRATVQHGPSLWRLDHIEPAGVRASYDRIAVPSADRRFVAHVVRFREMETVA
jgi:hypothetical protein